MIKFPNINLNNVKGVLLDLDNTLYSYDICHMAAIQECYSRYKNNISPSLSFTDFHNIYRQKRDLVTKRLSPSGACRSRMFAFQAMFEEIKLEKGFEIAQQYDEVYWDTLISKISLEQDASIFLQQCKDLEIDICIVTDMIANIQIKKLQKLGIVSNIKYLVTSEEVGAEKPDPRMFQACLNKLNLSPQEVIMIGDSENKDIKGAEAMGIKSYKVIIRSI